MNSTFVNDLECVSKSVSNVRGVHFSETVRSSFTVETTFEHPLNLIHVRTSEAYVDNYPRGEVSFVAGDVFHLMSAGDAVTVEALCKRIVDTCMLLQEVPLDMGGQETSSWARAASGEIITPPTSCQNNESTFTSGIHAQLLEDMQTTVGGLQFVDHPSLGLITATISISLEGLSDATIDAWEVLPNEPLQVSVTFQRKEYLAGTIRVEVGQARNFKERVFSGLPGQVKLIVQRFCEAHAPVMEHYLHAVQLGNVLEDVIAVSPGTGAVNLQKVADKLGVTSDAQRAHPPPTVKGFFNRLHHYVVHRVKTMASYCAICDRTLETGSLARLSICRRPVCTFRFETLEVGKNFGFQTALKTGIVDLLFNFAKTAACSARWELIFNPFPQASCGGQMVFSPETKHNDISVVRDIFKKLPSTFALLSTSTLATQLKKAHPLASTLFQWIISSNMSHLVKLEEADHFPFMKTPHQFVLSMSTDDRLDTFNELKAKHGSSWAFHGSNGENWHSILRNGLKNASGTKLQVNGTAYGNGVYLSPNAATSFGYSQISNPEPGFHTVADKDPTNKFIHRESMICISICEVIEKDIRKSGSVWVQPDEKCVMVRYFFVYHQDLNSRHDFDLSNADNLRMMKERSAPLIKR
ncbi:poly (ADP-ribose) polymerase, putative [Bodo saltans]|uniref:Poly [ADP-ribose] polymerase n=1 Tax=Bodo saltans TaxID=75058 RepID=A0A0S4IUV7_BODSA|nr:poly (ADP-ribose) polymerase, putative [Bodo saltans]|eukprot:CUF96424.1 poly (ADP-ribose) polymerase, putative [Bodo saltans]